MAQKLGIAMNGQENDALENIPQDGISTVDIYNPLSFKGKEITINEEEAAQVVSDIINQRRKELQ